MTVLLQIPLSYSTPIAPPPSPAHSAMLRRELPMPQIDYNLLTLAVGTGSLILLLIELRSNHVWNQKRTSYELMNETINSGHMTGAMDQLLSQFGWDLLGGTETYADVAARMKPDSARLQSLDQPLIVVMRHLEMVSISMSHGIIDETIVYDSMRYFFEKIYRAALPFIEKERARRGDADIYVQFERYARKWQADAVR